MTRQRKIIYDIIKENPEHLTAEEIYSLAKYKLPSIAIGTVYRNLSLMVEDGDIMKVELINAPDCYDKNVVPHHHMICEKCGRAEDIEIENLKPLIEKESGMKIISYDLNVHYICPNCSKSI